MPREPLAEEKQKRIIEMREDPDIETKSTISEEVGVARSTVHKYVEKHRDGKLDFDIDPSSDASGDASGDASSDASGDAPSAARESFESAADDNTPEGFTNEPPSGEGHSDGPDLAGMSKPEFIKWFFDKRGHGVRSGFANRLADQCMARDQLPDMNEMKRLLLDDSTGIDNNSSPA